MAGAGVPDAGEIVVCPRCGSEVRKKTMIPLLGDAGGTVLVCVTCAREQVATG